jgi:hypothetical protein
VAESGGASGIDILMRIRHHPFGSGTLSIAPTFSVFQTQHVAGRIKSHFGGLNAATEFACRSLGSVIDALIDKTAYQSLYLSYCIGAISEEEFEEQADHYARPLTSMPPEHLASRIGLLLTYSTRNFTTSDVSELFSVDERTADEAINLAAHFTAPASLEQKGFSWLANDR